MTQSKKPSRRRFSCLEKKRQKENSFKRKKKNVCSFVLISLTFSYTQVFIQVENVNDNAPLTEHPVYYPLVPESSPAGTKVLQLIAEDGDNDPLQKITYRITSGNPEGFFAINSSTGE